MLLSSDFRFAAGIAEFGLVLRDSPYRAAASLDGAIRQLESAIGEDPDGSRDECVYLAKVARDLKGPVARRRQVPRGHLGEGMRSRYAGNMVRLARALVSTALVAVPCALAQIDKPPEFEEKPSFRQAAPAALDSTSHVSARSEAVDAGLVAQMDLFLPPEASAKYGEFAAARDLVRQRSLAAAASAFEAGTRSDPRGLEMNAGHAIALYLTGRHEESVAATLALARRFPREARLVALLGETAIAAPHHRESSLAALRAFTKGLPANGAARFYLAKLLADGSAEAPAEAVALWKQAAGLDTGDPRPCLELARAATADRPAEAILWLERALSRDPSLPDAHYRLSRLYAKQGNKVRAEMHLDRYRKLLRNRRHNGTGAANPFPALRAPRRPVPAR